MLQNQDPLEPSIAFNLGTFEVSLEFHDCSHGHHMNSNDMTIELNPEYNSKTKEEVNLDPIEHKEDTDVEERVENGEQHTIHKTYNNNTLKSAAEDISKKSITSFVSTSDLASEDIGNDCVFNGSNEMYEGSQGVHGGYFLILLSNGLSNVAFKFPFSYFKEEPTSIISAITVRINKIGILSLYHNSIFR